MSQPNPSIVVNVDPTNPGQFFACCGLLELADRLWPGAEGWFAADGREFRIACGGTLRELLQAAQTIAISGMDSVDDSDEEESEDDDDDTLTPVEFVSPVGITLDWWADKNLKSWAGSMNVHRITLAMARAIDPNRTDPFQQCEVIYDPIPSGVPSQQGRQLKRKKREPFYFDSTRGLNAHSRDIGFSPNDLKKMTTTASPVVEFFCLVGLQRNRPMPTKHLREFRYSIWTHPLPISVVPVAVCCVVETSGCKQYQFRNAFRSGQKKLKAYLPSIPVPNKGV